MIRSITFSLALSIGLLSCDSQKKTLENQPQPHAAMPSKNLKNIELQIGQNQAIKGADLNLTYLSTLEDSRCPEGATCVWAGVAVIDLEVMTSYSRPQTIQLSTMDLENRDLKSTASAYGYIFTLKSVSPYPGTAKKSEHKIILDISKDE